MEFKFGAIPSTRDPRDYVFPAGAAKDEFPESYSSLFKLTNFNVLNQGQINSCVPHAITMAMMIKIALNNNGVMPNQPSQHMGYHNREDTDYRGEGMITRECLHNTQKYGLCPLGNYNNPMEVPEGYDVFNQQKDSLLEIAKELGIGNYYAIPIYENPRFPNSPLGFIETNSLKRAIIQNGSAVVCFYVFDNIYDVSKTNPMINYPDTSKTPMGGHAVLITGWRKDGSWQIVNSWGSEWGENGIFYAPIDYPFHEAWTFDDVVTEKPKEHDGWYKVGDEWHYRKDGKDSIEWVKVNNKWYYFTTDGVMLTGWILYKGKWYWTDNNGVMVSDAWRYIGGRWYYFISSGEAVTGPNVINGKLYYFSEATFGNIKECQLIITDGNGEVK